MDSLPYSATAVPGGMDEGGVEFGHSIHTHTQPGTCVPSECATLLDKLSACACTTYSFQLRHPVCVASAGFVVTSCQDDNRDSDLNV